MHFCFLSLPGLVLPSLDALPTTLAALDPTTKYAAAAATTAFAANALQPRVLAFTRLDEAEAISFVQSFPTTRITRWGPKEWREFGLDRLEFSAVRTPNGIRLDYFKRGIGGLVDDGSFDISVTKWLGFPAIVASSRGGVENRARQESSKPRHSPATSRRPARPRLSACNWRGSVVWQRLVLAATGDGSGGGALGLANLKAKSGVGSAILAPFCPDRRKIERIDLIMVRHAPQRPPRFACPGIPRALCPS